MWYHVVAALVVFVAAFRTDVVQAASTRQKRVIHMVENELPTAELFTKLGPGQLTSAEYEGLANGRSGFSVGRGDHDNVTIRNADVALTPKQYAYLFEESSRSGYKAEIDERKRWTDGVIPYTIDAGYYSDYQTRELHRALEIFEKFTCLRFKPKDSGDKNWVKFTDNNSGCNSQLGMMNWGEQSVNLGVGCKWRGLYFHEIGHALGLIHEHQRPDRDDHVRVIWRRVKSDFLSAFTKYKNEAVNDFGIEYDYSSIMHYEPESFNDNQEQTTVPHDKWKVELMFRVFYKTLSWTDTRVLNEMYQCGKSCNNGACPQNSYKDKYCNCVTPRDIHDAICVNERSDQECYEKVRKGECDGAWGAAEMHIECRKACGSCPTYGMKDFVEPRLSQPYDACADRYHDSGRCASWAAAGDCDAYPHWMLRNCRKSCNACNKDLDKSRCRNYYKGAIDNENCDRMAAEGKCDTDPQVKAGCQGSCNSCGFQLPGKCTNLAGDVGCRDLAAIGQCDDDNPYRAAQLQAECKQTCNSCTMNEGKCENEMHTQECEVAAARGKCRIESAEYKKICRKTCNSCDFGITDPSCKDIHPDWSCKQWADTGTCSEAKGYAYRFCASSCNKCEWARNPPCEDMHDMCESWSKSGECDTNHQWMTTHCAKSCGTCDRYGLDKCTNVDNDAFCEIQKKHGNCEKFAGQMERDCKRSCGHCPSPGPIEKFWECKDISKNCEYWRSIGECEKNPVYLEAFCHKSCGYCRQ